VWFHAAAGGLVLLGGLLQLSAAAGAVPRFSVLTTRPNVVVAPVHRRMAVVLDDKRLDGWFTTAPAVALQMLTPASPSAVVATKVSNHVNKVKHDDPAHCTSGSGAARLPVLENSGSAGSRLGDGRHTGRLSDPARKLPSLSRDPRSNRQPTALWMHVRCPENGGVRC
jgi:hypothetical protein